MNFFSRFIRGGERRLYRSLDPDGSTVDVAGIEGTRDVLFLPQRLAATFGAP